MRVRAKRARPSPRGLGEGQARSARVRASGSRLGLLLAEAEALELAGLRARERGDELDAARILVGGDAALGEILQRLHHLVAHGRALAADDEGLHHVAALLVRR